MLAKEKYSRMDFMFFRKIKGKATTNFSKFLADHNGRSHRVRYVRRKMEPSSAAQRPGRCVTLISSGRSSPRRVNRGKTGSLRKGCVLSPRAHKHRTWRRTSYSRSTSSRRRKGDGQRPAVSPAILSIELRHRQTQGTFHHPRCSTTRTSVDALDMNENGILQHWQPCHQSPAEGGALFLTQRRGQPPPRRHEGVSTLRRLQVYYHPLHGRGHTYDTGHGWWVPQQEATNKRRRYRLKNRSTPATGFGNRSRRCTRCRRSNNHSLHRRRTRCLHSSINDSLHHRRTHRHHRSNNNSSLNCRRTRRRYFRHRTRFRLYTNSPPSSSSLPPSNQQPISSRSV